MKKKACLWIIFFFGLVATAKAYFLVVIQEKGGGYATRGEKISWLVFRGEPFQGLVRDLITPKAFMRTPQGGKDPVAFTVIELKDYKTGKKRHAFYVRYTPTQEGDYYLCLLSQKTYIPELNEVWREITKVPLHVESEKAWEIPVGLELEIVPLTRPYGLTAGQIFRGKVFSQGTPASHVLVQVTHYHGLFLPWEALPKDAYGKLDRPLMYLSLYTDDNGTFSVALNQPGWWLVSVRVPQGFVTLANQRFPLFLRGSLWLYVRPPFVPQGSFPKIVPTP